MIGIRGIAPGWFRSDLSDRYPFAHVHYASSWHARFSHGVPSGSVLGAVLFTF